ncbi:MAG: hypothetical protein Q4G39_01885, partial [Brachymonas sp.]|nr:hypothetical protein [Brachymonas sp.]
AKKLALSDFLCFATELVTSIVRQTRFWRLWAAGVGRNLQSRFRRMKTFNTCHALESPAAVPTY